MLDKIQYLQDFLYKNVILKILIIPDCTIKALIN